MPTSDFTTMVATLLPTRSWSPSARPDLCDRPNRRQAEHAGAGVGIHAADGCRFRTRHRPAGRRHAQRRAEERFWRRGRALFAAVAAVTSTLGALLFVWAARSIRGDIQRAS